jgi:LysM repeat protein
MEIDKNIKNKLEERAIQPSVSAWERLSDQLDTHARRKRRRQFFYISSAASILLLASIFLLWTKSDVVDRPILPEETIVIAPVDTTIFENKLDAIIKKEVTPIVDNNNLKKETIVRKIPQEKKRGRVEKNIPIVPESTVSNEVIVVHKESVNKSTPVIEKKIKKHSRISVDSEALLYSVTHTEAEVIAYYKKYKIDRNDVLSSIKKELKKSNLKINANSILAEVERDIDDASFKKNFMSIIKKRVSDIASAIASRND